MGGRSPEARTLGIHVHLTPTSHTEALNLARDPLASALAYQTPLMAPDTLSLPTISIPARRQIHPFRVRSRLVCAPSLDPHFLRRRQSFVLRKAVPQLLLPRPFRPIPWTQRMPFLKGKKTPPIHHGQAAQRPQHESITQMPLLT